MVPNLNKTWCVVTLHWSSSKQVLKLLRGAFLRILYSFCLHSVCILSVFCLHSDLAPPLQALACLHTFHQENLFASWWWSLKAKHNRNRKRMFWVQIAWLSEMARVADCRRNAREASRGASSRGTPAPCLQALGIKVQGQVPCSHLSLHISAHLGTHTLHLFLNLYIVYWTLHYIHNTS